MKAFLIATLALIVIALGASFVLDETALEPSSDRYTAAGTVRLDPGQRSDARYPE